MPSCARCITSTPIRLGCQKNYPTPRANWSGRPTTRPGAAQSKKNGKCAICKVGRCTHKPRETHPRERLGSRTCGSRGSTWTGKRGCTTTRSGTTMRTLGGLLARTRLGWRAGSTWGAIHRIRLAGLILGDWLASGKGGRGAWGGGSGCR